MLQSKSNLDCRIAILEDKGKDSLNILNPMDLYQHSIFHIHPIDFQHQWEEPQISWCFQATHLASQLLEERPEDVAAQRLFKFGKPSGCDWGVSGGIFLSM